MARKPRELKSLMRPLANQPAEETPPPAAPAKPEKELVPLNILVTPADRHRLKQIALDSGSSLQKMGIEAWSDWLEARGLPPLEPVTANVPSGRRR